MIGIIGTRAIAIFTTLYAPLCVGCFATATGPDTDPAQVVLETRLPGSPSAPARLVVTFASSERDTLRDTVTEDGSRLSRRYAFLDARAGVRQSVRTEYSLAPNRRWKVMVRLLDERDSLQMSDSGSLGAVKAFEHREATVAPAPRFATCPVRFVLPAARGARALRFTRLQLLVDGKVMRDSIAPLSKPFAPGEANAVLLAGDYLEQGTRQLTFKAYGLVGDHDESPRLLYQGAGAVQAVAGQVATAGAITLDWEAEEAAQEPADLVGLQVSIGKVGMVTVTAQMSGAIDL